MVSRSRYTGTLRRYQAPPHDIRKRKSFVRLESSCIDRTHTYRNHSHDNRNYIESYDRSRTFTSIPRPGSRPLAAEDTDPADQNHASSARRNLFRFGRVAAMKRVIQATSPPPAVLFLTGVLGHVPSRHNGPASPISAFD